VAAAVEWSKAQPVAGWSRARRRATEARKEAASTTLVKALWLIQLKPKTKIKN